MACGHPRLFGEQILHNPLVKVEDIGGKLRCVKSLFSWMG